MSGFGLREFLALAILVMVYVSISSAGPAKHWQSDPRCSGPGGSTGHARVGRGLGRNGIPWFGSQTSSSYFVFNPNWESCESRYGELPKNTNFFRTKSDCERVCLDVYHV